MAGCADNKQFNFKLPGKFDDVSHQMSGDEQKNKRDNERVDAVQR
jgi:hypothetical protein